MLCFVSMPGQHGDALQAQPLLTSLPPAAFCLPDAAHDSAALRAFLRERNTIPVIPNNPTRKRPQPFDLTRYKDRNGIERTVGRLKNWRRVHTRHSKLATNFASAVALTALLRKRC